MNEKQKSETNKKVALIAPYKGNSKSHKSSSSKSKGNTTDTDLTENEKLKVRAERFKAHLKPEPSETSTSTTKQRYTKSQTSFTATVKTGVTPSKQWRKPPREGYQTQSRKRREERCENVLSKVEERIRRRKERSAVPPENLLIKVTVRTQNEGYVHQEGDDYDDPGDHPVDYNQHYRDEDRRQDSPVNQGEYYESDQSVDYIDSPRSDTPSEWSSPAYEPVRYRDSMVRHSDSDRDFKGNRFDKRFEKDQGFHSDLYEDRARTPERFHRRLEPQREKSGRFASTEEYMDDTESGHRNRSKDRVVTPERFRNRLDHSERRRERIQTPERLRERLDSSLRKREKTETTVLHRERSETTVHHKERIHMSVRHRDEFESPERFRDRRRSPPGSRERAGGNVRARDRSPEHPRDNVSLRERNRRSRKDEFTRGLATPPRRRGQPERPYRERSSEITPEKVKAKQSSSKRFREDITGSYSYRRRMSSSEELESRDFSKRREKVSPVNRKGKYREPMSSETRYRQQRGQELLHSGLSRNPNLEEEEYDPMEPTIEGPGDYEDQHPTRRLPGQDRALGNVPCDQDFREMIPHASVQSNRYQEILLPGVRDQGPMQPSSSVLPPNTFDYCHGIQRTQNEPNSGGRFDKTHLGGKKFPSPQTYLPLGNKSSEGRDQWLATDFHPALASRNDQLNLNSNLSTNLLTGNIGSISIDPQYKADNVAEIDPYTLTRHSPSVQYPGALGTKGWSNGGGPVVRGQPDRYLGQRSSPNQRAMDRNSERRSNMDDSFEDRNPSRTRASHQGNFDRSRSRSEERERRRNLRDRSDIQHNFTRLQPRERGKY